MRTAIKERAREVDIYVGFRIRERRIMLGLTQQDMADLIGVTYQQAHKYEKGTNRVSAGRLFDIAQALSVPVGYFFEGAGSPERIEPTTRQRMLLELVRNFSEIKDPRHQEAIAFMARAMLD